MNIIIKVFLGGFDYKLPSSIQTSFCFSVPTAIPRDHLRFNYPATPLSLVNYHHPYSVIIDAVMSL